MHQYSILYSQLSFTPFKASFNYSKEGPSQPSIVMASAKVTIAFVAPTSWHLV